MSAMPVRRQKLGIPIIRSAFDTMWEALVANPGQRVLFSTEEHIKLNNYQPRTFAEYLMAP